MSGPAVIRPVPAGRGTDVPSPPDPAPRAGPADLEPDADGFVFLPGASTAGRPVNPTSGHLGESALAPAGRAGG